MKRQTGQILKGQNTEKDKHNKQYQESKSERAKTKKQSQKVQKHGQETQKAKYRQKRSVALQREGIPRKHSVLKPGLVY